MDGVRFDSVLQVCKMLGVELQVNLKSGRYEVGVSSTTANPLVYEYGSSEVLDVKRLPAFEVYSSLKYKLINKVKIKELVTETFDL
ncbi:MAG: hypothetical protein KC478_06465 [Bacteriovoracaceae bacterium]|nr:hypothetical protein [Bacteriovoracaceae bacterium]